MPANAPWDPVPASRGAAPRLPALTHLGGPVKSPAPATVEARALQASAFRRIWSTLLDHRDWVSYIYVPIIVPILVLMPYLVARFYETSHQQNKLINTLSQGSRDYKVMSQLLHASPTPWKGETPEKVRTLDEPNLKGFQILQDSRIIDLRGFKPDESGKSDANSLAYVYRRLRVVKEQDNTNNQVFRLSLLATSPQTAVRFPVQALHPTLKMCDLENTGSGQGECRWEVSYDFRRVAVGEHIDLIKEEHSPGHYLHGNHYAFALPIPIQVETAELTMWALMPRGKEYRSFRIVRYLTSKQADAEKVRIVTEYLADDFTILAFKLLALKPGYTYEVSWVYK
jgi:hypothetical protein